MKKDKRRFERRWTDKINAVDLGLIFAFGITVGVIISVVIVFSN